MVTAFWKGGQSGQENNPDNIGNWVTTSGGSTTIHADDHTGLTNGTTDVVIDYATAGTNYCEILTGTAKKNWKSVTINYHASLARILRINGTDADNKAVLTLRGMTIKNNTSLFSSGFGQIKFTGVPLYTTDNSPAADLYIKIDSTDDSSLDTDDVGGMFFDGASRKALTFLFEPPASTTLTLQNGIYPNMDFDAAGNTATLSFESLGDASKTNKYTSVSMLNLTVDNSITVSPRTYNFSDKNKHIKIRGTLALTCATFNMGLATFELIPVSSAIKFPVTGSPTYGVSNNFNATFADVIIGTPSNQSHLVTIEDNTVLSCEHLHIKAGGRLYGPIYGSDNSAEIHTTKAVTLDGDWNFSQKATGVYRTTGTQHRLNVSSGGTGLNTIPDLAILYGDNRGPLSTLTFPTSSPAGKVLAINDDGDGFVWSASAGGGTGTTYTTSVVQSSGIKLRLTGSNSSTDDVKFAGSGATSVARTDASTITISSTDTNTTYSEATSSAEGLMSTAHHDKLDGIEASADVTDTANVTSAGALMDSELADLAGVKGVTISTLQVKPSEGAFANGDKTKLDNIEASATADQTASEITALLNDVANYTLGTNSGTITVGDDLTVTGDLIVSGATTTLNTATLDVEDLNITVGKAANSSSAANGAGLTFGAWSSGTTPTLIWSNPNTRLEVNKSLYSSGGFVGGGSLLTALNGSQVTSGTIAAARVATLNQDTTGTAAGLSATLAISSGGTGATNSNAWLNSRITTNADGSLNYDATGATAVNHDSLAGFVSAEHIDWAGANAGTIHSTNIPTLNQNTTGNAATATKLATARAINGVNFDGSADITITAAGSTLSDTVTVAKGGTGATTLTSNAILTGNGTSAIQAESTFTYDGAGIAVISGDLPQLQLVDSNATNDPMARIMNNNGNLSIRADSSNVGTGGAINFQTSGSEKMRIQDNGNVGIGTTSPQANLHISGGTGGDGVLIIEADTDNNAEADQPYIVFEQDGGTQHSAIGSHSGGNTDNNALIFSNSVGSSGVEAGMIFKTGETAGYANATERMRITPAGNVGIGTTSPSTALHVKGSGVQKITVESTDNEAALELSSDSSGPWIINSGNGSNDLRWYGNGAVRMQLTSDGELGIGTTSPASLLHVGSTAYELSSGAYLTSSHQRTAKMVIHADDANTDWDEQEIGLALHNEDPTNNNWSPHIAFTTHEDDDGDPTNANPVAVAAISATYNTRVANGWAKGDLVFFTNGGGSGNAERMRITSAGDTTISGNLLLNSSNKELRFYEGANYVGFEAPALSADQIWVLPASDGSANQALTTDGSGNFQWTSAGSIAGVGSNLSLANGTNNRIVTAVDGSNINGEANLTFDGSVLALTGDLNVGSGDFFVDDSSGNAGIGTNAPVSKLQVVQDDAQFTIIAGADVNAQSLTDDTRKFMRFGMPHYDTDEQSFSLITGDSDNGVNRLYLGGGTGVGNAATQIYFRTAANATTTTGTTRMTVTSDGKVGIGTESPTYELDVVGNIGVDQYIYHNGDTDTYLNLQTDDARMVVGNDIAWWYDEGSASKLHLSWNGEADVEIGNAGATPDFFFGGSQGSSGAYNGRMGIGTITPSSALDVVGTIECTGLKLQDGTLDYGTGKQQSEGLAVGWYTVAYVAGRDALSGVANQRAFGEFLINCNKSSRHGSVRFNATHFFGNGESIQALAYNFFSTPSFSKLRIKSGGTYSGAAIQLYVSNSSNDLESYMTMTEHSNSWLLLDTWLLDTESAGAHDALVGYGTDAWANFAVAEELDLSVFHAHQGGIYTTGGLKAEEIRLGKTATNSYLYLSPDTDNSFILASSSGTDVTLAADDDLVLHADDAIIFQTEGSTKFGMHNGRFGIGVNVATTTTYPLGIESADGLAINQGTNDARQKRIFATTSNDGSPWDEMVYYSRGSVGGWSGQHTFMVDKNGESAETGYEALRIRDSGDGSNSIVAVTHKLGVGTTNPEDLLHISKGNLIFDQLGNQTSGNFTNHSKILFRDEADATTRTMASIGAPKTAWSGSHHALTFNTGSLSETSRGEDYDYSIERMRIDSAGNVGIGTTSPASQLDISSASTSTLRLSNSDTALTEGQITGEIIFYQDEDSGSGDGITGRIGMRSAPRSDGTYYGNAADMGFFVAGLGNYSAANQNADLEAMSIRAGGKVGIGVTAPSNKLHVALSMADGDDGILLTRTDSSTSTNDILGGIGFDSSDGNIPSSVLEASVAIVGRAREDHGTGDKGGYLDFYYAPTDQDDDTTSRRGMRMMQGKLAVGGQNSDVGDPINSLVVEHVGGDWHNGILVLRDDDSIAEGDLLGAIGFDGKDGNNPSSVLEASVALAAYASEDHGTGDKGGYLSVLLTETNDDDDTTSTEVMRVSTVSAGTSSTLTLKNGNVSMPADTKYAAIDFHNVDSSGAGVGASINAMTSASGRGGYLEFQTGITVGGVSTKLTINDDGNVGIGTNTPFFATGIGLEIENASQANLRVTDSSASASSDFAQSENDLYIINRKSGGNIRMRVGGSTETILMDSDGDIKFANGATSSWATWNSVVYSRKNYNNYAGSGAALYVEYDGTGTHTGHLIPFTAKIRAIAFHINGTAGGTVDDDSTTNQTWNFFKGGNTSDSFTTVTFNNDANLTRQGTTNHWYYLVTGLNISVAAGETLHVRRDSGAVTVGNVRIEVFYSHV